MDFLTNRKSLAYSLHGPWDHIHVQDLDLQKTASSRATTVIHVEAIK